jgi:hypothetical protein
LASQVEHENRFDRPVVRLAAVIGEVDCCGGLIPVTIEDSRAPEPTEGRMRHDDEVENGVEVIVRLGLHKPRIRRS